MASLHTHIAARDNNYAEAGANFKVATGQCIVRGKARPSHDITISCSIIIPFFISEISDHRIIKTLSALLVQELDPEYSRANIEIILVNDGSQCLPPAFEDACLRLRKLYQVIIITLEQNEGRSVARNAGLHAARKECLILLDSDIIVQTDFVRNHLIRHQYCEGLVMVGLQEAAHDSDLALSLHAILTKNLPAPDPAKDFRSGRYVPASWKSIYGELSSDTYEAHHSPLKRTRYFQGYGNGRLIGPWDLSSMVLTGNLSLKRLKALEAGGFDVCFKGWGMEDTYFGARLVAGGAYIVPLLSATSYHLKGPQEPAIRTAELLANMRMYRRLLKESYIPSSPESTLKELGHLLKGKIASVVRLSLPEKPLKGTRVAHHVSSLASHYSREAGGSVQ